MDPDNLTLADIDGFGRIYHCGNCSYIHFQVGPVSLTLTRPAFMQLVNLVNVSAANYEHLMSWPPSAAASRSNGDDHEPIH